ncbi:MAG: hypothetical protein J0L56_12420 [Chitinophagales bacterium]|nr:hypothetical protein [Chitinophagales bacterium]
MWLLIGGGMITLLAAAMRQQKSERCKDYTISINGAKENLFVDEKDVLKLLSAGTKGNIKGQPMSAFDLLKLEQLLEKNVWIKDAELYFDNKDVLHVSVTEREPIARIFSTTGKSFYIDKEEKKIPLPEKMSANVPVFTGFPEMMKRMTGNDSSLLHDIAVTAGFINKNPFWTAQVAQIDINMAGEFEMVPVVGNHTVKLGKGDHIEAKFNRLFVFYKNILSKTGFDKYRTIDVQYAGQVVGVKGFTTKVDSIQLRRNVEKLLQQARDMNYDTAARVTVSQPVPYPAAENDIPLNATTSIINDDGPNPNPLKLSETGTKPTGQDPKPVQREPKAVMPKRNN